MTRQPIDDVIERVQGVYSRWRRDTPVSQMRDDWNQLFGAHVAAAIEPVDVGSIPCIWVRPEGVRRDAVIVYFHGGGFQIGSVASHREMMAWLATEAGIQVLGVDYRLAPENPLPAALDDGTAVVDWLEATGFPADRIACAGDSAGGLIALDLAIQRSKKGRPRLAAAFLMSPWTDLTISGESYATRASLDPIHRSSMLKAQARVALGPNLHEQAADYSPLLAQTQDLSSLPPVLMQVGEREVLVSDTVNFGERARAAGSSAEYEIWPGMIHVFQQFPNELPEARQALKQGANFLAVHLRGPQMGTN